MEKHELLVMFKKDSQNWKIVNHILSFRKIYNHEIHSQYHICNHTARISEIRKKLEDNCCAILAVHDSGKGEYYYIIL